VIEVEMKPLKDIITNIGNDTQGRLSTSHSIVKKSYQSEILPPKFKSGPNACPPIANFEYPEVSIADFSNAIVTATGAVIVDDRYVVEETVEGSLEDNCFNKSDGRYFFDLDRLEVTSEDIISFNKFGIFNYSIFLTEIMPSAYLSSLTRDFCNRRFVISFPGFMSQDAIELRWKVFSSCGFEKKVSIIPAGNGIRANKVGIVKANARYKNHRASQLAPYVSTLLKMTFATSEPSSFKRIYIRRQNVARSIENFDDLLPILNKHDVIPVSLENMPVDQQVDLFSKADFVLAEHGAGLVNTMFMRPGSTVVEMFPEPLVGRWAFRLVSHTFKLNYCFGTFGVPEGWKWAADNISLNPKAIDAFLTKLLPHPRNESGALEPSQ